MTGGLGGLGGLFQDEYGGMSPLGQVIQATGMSLMSSPRGAPLSNFPTAFGNVQQAAQKQKAEGQERQALMYALKQAGFDEATAKTLAQNPAAAKIAIEQKQSEDGMKLFNQGFGDIMGGGSPAPGPQAAGNDVIGKAKQAIAGLESGGRYDALGPVTKGDRAYGKYQVMGANVPSWTMAALGKTMTPEEFLKNPEAQEKVFEHRFGQYLQQYGNPQDAASVWFSGRPLAQAGNRKDILGTTVPQYVQKFTAGMGGGQPAPAPTRVASLDPRVGLPGATEAPQQAPAGPQVAQAPSTAQSDAAPIKPVMFDTQEGQNKIRRLGYYIAHPKAPAGLKELAKIQLQSAMEDSKLTPDQKEYLGAVRQGYTGSFVDYQIRMKEAGRSQVNINPGEGKFEQEVGSLQAKRFMEVVKAGDDATKRMADIQTLRETSRAIGNQGKAAEFKQMLGPYAAAYGIEIEGLPDIQVFESVVKKLAPQMRAEGSGSTSDVEYKGFIQAIGPLTNHPAAREMILDTFESLARHEQARADIARRAVSGEIKRADAEKELAALPDPLTAFKEFRKQNPDLYSQAVRQQRQKEHEEKQAERANKGEVLAIPQGAIDLLKSKASDPAVKQQFDAKYGKGAADKVLGGKL